MITLSGACSFATSRVYPAFVGGGYVVIESAIEPLATAHAKLGAVASLAGSTAGARASRHNARSIASNDSLLFSAS